jgi:hypothetical protein
MYHDYEMDYILNWKRIVSKNVLYKNIYNFIQWSWSLICFYLRSL